MGDPKKRKKFIASLPRQDRVKYFKKTKHVRLVDDDGTPPYVELRAKRVQDVLKDDVSGLSAYSAPHLKCPLEFEFVRSSSELKQGDIKACIRLVEMTSSQDYRESSIGWHPREKMEEMMHKDMMYLLVRQGDVSAVPEEEGDDEGIEMAGQEDTKMEGQGAPQLNALEQLIQGSASDSDEEEATTPDTTLLSPAESAAIAHSSPATTKKPQWPLPENNGHILGFISFMFTWDDPPHADREVAYIYEIHLREQLRCQGLGSTLIQFVEDAARACEVDKCMLTVFTANGRARLMYGRRGYVKDACSPKGRVTRRKVIESEYQIMSKVLE